MHALSRHHAPRPAASTIATGFTLVEVMVGMVISMIGMIVMMQVFTLAEGHKRSTTAGGDAQSNGAIALFSLDREIRQGGYGASDLSIIGCNLLLPNGVTLNALAPVTINHSSIPAGDANTDTLLIVTGSSNGSPEGDGIVRSAANVYTVMTPTSFTIEDFVIAQTQVRPTACNLAMEAVIAVNANPPTVTVGRGPSATIANGRLFNMGKSPKIQGYAIRGGNLMVCDFLISDCTNAASINDDTVWAPVSGSIVSLRAQYGKDTTAPTMDAIPDTYDQFSPSAACGWARIASVRLAVVARSDQYEKAVVTYSAPAWAAGDSLALDLTANTEWQHYRYKVFQSLVPLRNIVSLGVRSTC